MRRPPPLNTCLRLPVTTTIIAMAIIATWRWHSGANIGPFLLGSENWFQQPWRFVTPMLFHVNILHLVFNLYWFWVFGSLLEFEFGSGRTLALYLLIAVVPINAEIAFLHGGVGLSGVVYGQVGILWVLSRNDRRFQDAMDRQTMQLMIIWFFLCIVLTVTDVWKIGNVAHGVGLVLGVLLGWALSARKPAHRIGSGIALAVLTLLSIVGATVARPWVNFSAEVASEFAHQNAYDGYRALVDEDPKRAATMLEQAVAMQPNVAGWWFNLGLAYKELGRLDDSLRTYRRALDLDPHNAEFRRALRQIKQRIESVTTESAAKNPSSKQQGDDSLPPGKESSEEPSQEP
jgi:membrane associated rhomboid family serine protease